MRIVIDRYEGEFAVCETDAGERYILPSALFEGAKEGSVFDISYNAEETERRSEKTRSLLHSLFKK